MPRTPDVPTLLAQLKEVRAQIDALPERQRALCLALRDAGVTQYQVAKALGTSRHTVNRWYREYAKDS